MESEPRLTSTVSMPLPGRIGVKPATSVASRMKIVVNELKLRSGDSGVVI